jgi:hypothetical protein
MSQQSASAPCHGAVADGTSTMNSPSMPYLRSVSGSGGHHTGSGTSILCSTETGSFPSSGAPACSGGDPTPNACSAVAAGGAASLVGGSFSITGGACTLLIPMNTGDPNFGSNSFSKGSSSASAIVSRNPGSAGSSFLPSRSSAIRSGLAAPMESAGSITAGAGVCSPVVAMMMAPSVPMA